MANTQVKIGAKIGAMIAWAMAAAACQDVGARESGRDDGVIPQAGAAALTPAERRLYQDLARRSWNYLDRYYQPATGFVNATPDWYNTTLWDIGGQILAYHAAKELGLLSEQEYDRRMRTMLGTLARLELFDGVTFNRIYSTKDGSPSAQGAGWSATDIGRFLVALKILAEREPRYAELAGRVARRSDFARIVKDGYLHGRARSADGTTTDFQEGRIGYEQYVAAGFQHWGADVGNAVSLANGTPVDVLGVRLLADRRGFDRLLSEPFILYGIELGLPDDLRDLAGAVLDAQEARYRATGQITIASEDAMPVAPHHFYYYCVYCNGKAFVIGISSPREIMDAPRWVSTKAAFGWHALMPSAYTQKAVDHVAAARHDEQGWATGVFEGTGKSTDTYDVTNAAVLMEIAYFQLRGRRPLIEPATVRR